MEVWHRIRGWLRGRDKGTVAVTFLLSLPILLLVIGIFVQYALLVNARLTLERALDAAARSAMTSIPTNQQTEFVDAQANIRKSACMVLAPLSPMSDAGPSAEANEIASALDTTGVLTQDGFSSFARRYTFAEQNAQITLDVPQDPTNKGTSCTVTITYPFRLNVAAARLLVGAWTQPSGMNSSDRYFSLTVSRTVQLSPGRETVVGTTGIPTGVSP